MSTIKETVEILENKYDFKYNELSLKILYKLKDENKYIEVDDLMFNSLYMDCKINVKGLNQNDFSSILYSNICKRYNPFEEYFNNLPKWDGKRDYIKELSSTIKVRRNRYWTTYFKKWLIGAVACIIDESFNNHLVLIFVGKQGVGKTTWLNKLLPKELNDHLYMGTISQNKDSQIHLSECMYINIDEFETIGRKGLNQLKSIITQSHIRIRRPYGRINESLMRRASFMASVNDFKFLVDATGNRRFLVFEVNDINFKHNVDMKMVYSQCLHLYKDGFKPFLNEKDARKVNRINEEYIIKPYEEEVLMDVFEPTPKGTGKILTTTQILQRINEKSKSFINNTSLIILGKALGKNKFEKGRTKSKAHGWWVKEKKDERALKSDFD